MTPEQKRDRDTLRKAIAEAVTKGARNASALNSVLRTICRGGPPTAVPLSTPCLDPDKMNGAADQFPGSDFGDELNGFFYK